MASQWHIAESAGPKAPSSDHLANGEASHRPIVEVRTDCPAGNSGTAVRIVVADGAERVARYSAPPVRPIVAKRTYPKVGAD